MKNAETRWPETIGALYENVCLHCIKLMLRHFRALVMDLTECGHLSDKDCKIRKLRQYISHVNMDDITHT